jgi:hypothetical protein
MVWAAAQPALVVAGRKDTHYRFVNATSENPYSAASRGTHLLLTCRSSGSSISRLQVVLADMLWHGHRSAAGMGLCAPTRFPWGRPISVGAARTLSGTGPSKPLETRGECGANGASVRRVAPRTGLSTARS